MECCDRGKPYRAVFRAREAIKEFLRRGIDPSRSIACGKIIHISSVHEIIPWAGHANYATSKGESEC
jgi:glucose 1-dehydrogenase